MKENKTEAKTMKKGRDSYSSIKLWARRDKRKEEAFERQIEHDSLSTEEKIAKCKFRAKKGMGESKREHTRLLIRLEKEKEAKKAAKVTAPTTPAAPAASVKTKKTGKTAKAKKNPI
jgi:hypothetical protein